MKIVVNAYSARLGGGQTYLKNLFAHLPQEPGLEVQFFGPEALVLPAHPQVRRVHAPWPTTNPLLRTVWERFLLPAYLRRERADVLFCPGGVVATKPPRGCRVVTMFRNMIPFDEALMQRMPWGLQKLRNLILARVMLRSMSQADLTIFISDHTRALIEAKARIPQPVTIPHGIGEAFRTKGRALSRPSGLPQGEYILYVSRFDIYKHHKEVVAAYAALPQALRERHALVFLGENLEPEHTRVRQQLRDLGLEGRVHFGGAAPYAELPAYYQHASAILFASSCENCPNILLESLGSGRPVLSSDVMPMPEFGGPDLLYFSPFDAATLTPRLREVLEDPALAERLADAAYTRSLRFDWARTAGDTWRRILALGPAAPTAGHAAAPGTAKAAG